jgi:anaerobic selenocysteine-containing dehydrogenase
VDPLGEGLELPELEFLVVQDVFLTETAKCADVFIPLRAPFEERGTLLLPHPSSLTPLPQKKLPPTWAVFLKLSQLMGETWQVESTEAVWEELSQLLVSEPQGEVSPAAREQAAEGVLAVQLYHRFSLPKRAWGERSELGRIVPSWDSIGLSPADLGALGISPGERVEVKHDGVKITGRAWEWGALPPGLIALPFRGVARPPGPAELNRAEEVD